MPSFEDDEGIEAALRELHEVEEIEIKQWIDPGSNESKAMIAKEIMSLANFGGGLLIFGFAEQADGTFAPDPNVPPDFRPFSADAFQGIIDRYLMPPVQCRVLRRRHPTLDVPCVVVRVPSLGLVPIRPKKGDPSNHSMVPWRLYTRRKGGKSDEIQTDEEWNRLLGLLLQNRRGEMLTAFRALLEGELPRAAAEPTREDRLKAFSDEARALWAEKVAALPADSPARFPHGYHEVMLAYSRVQAAPSLLDLQEAIRDRVRDHSGWPPFVTIDRMPLRPYLRHGAVEAWGAPEDDWREPDQHDFWRISQDGCFYLRRGLREDSRPNSIKPGDFFDLTTSVRKVAEAIVQAKYLAPAFGAEEADLICRVKFVGLDGRWLAAAFSNRMLIRGRYQVHQDSYEAESVVSVSALPDLLPETTERLLRPLYDLFGFRMPAKLFGEEITDLLRHQY